MNTWEAKARAAFDRYIEDLKQAIEPGSGLGGIEAAMMRLSPPMLGRVMESLSESEEAISPPGDTPGVGQKRTALAKPPKRVRSSAGQGTAAEE